MTIIPSEKYKLFLYLTMVAKPKTGFFLYFSGLGPYLGIEMSIHTAQNFKWNVLQVLTRYQ